MKFAPLTKSLADAVNKAPLIVGIGPSAWPRIASSFYFPNFKILCYSDCQDNELIRKTGVEVYSLRQEDPFLEVTPITPGKIIETKLAKKYLDGLEQPFTFLVYKSYPIFEKICREKGWSFIGNTIETRERYEDKRIFKEILGEIGIEKIPGENIPIESLTEEKFEFYQKSLGKNKLVLQIAEATWGGGSGTFFIEEAGQLKIFFERLKELRKSLEGKKKKLETVNVAPFIEGTSASIPCCATKHGVFTGSIQTQILDIPEVGTKLNDRSGVFAGHDWSYKKYSQESNRQAAQIGRKFGEYLYQHGYRGIFGLDLIVEESGKVWPVECNPRETDAFPLICMLQMTAGAIPMQVFHNLEHLNIEYDIDFEKVDESYKTNFEASQIILYNKTDKYLIDREALNAGVYKIQDGELAFVRTGLAVWDLESEDEYLITEDISKAPGNIYDPHERMIRLIKKGGMLDVEGNLKKDIAIFVEKVYQKMKLLPIELGLVDEDGLSLLFTKKLKDAKVDDNLNKADIVNVIRRTGGGVERPLEIVWRKRIDKGDILGQIKSKRTQKHIVSDLRKVNEMGIRIEVLDEIDQQVFDKWLVLYREVIGAKEKGHVVIGESWLKTTKEKGKKVGALLAYRGEELVGGELFLEKNKTLGIGYGIAKKVEGLSGGLTLLLDYTFMEYAQKNGYQEVSFGQDGNLYGYDLNPGLILYKAKLGFTPMPARKTYWVTSYFRNFNKLADPVMLFTGDFEKINSLTVITDSKELDFKAYLPEDINEIKLFSRDEILKKQIE